MLTTLLIFWPLFAAVIMLILNAQLAKGWALIASLIELVLTLIVINQFDPATANSFTVNYPWIASLGINFYVGIDGN